MKGKKKSFIPLAEGQKLNCASPTELEDFLRACENHKLIDVEICHFNHAEQGFECVNPDDHKSILISVEDADNYFCVSDRDLARIKERCD